jgi:AcrR family transcriptional regulator
MPRAFSERERGVIRERLRAAGRDAFRAQGLRRTSVEELARAAGISKGAFYLFYPSKEALFFDVLEQFEIAMRERLLRELDGAPRDGPRLLLATALSLREAEPLLERLAVEDAAYLLRTVSEEQARELLQGDVAFVAEVVERLGRAGVGVGAEPAVLAGLLRALFFVSLHREEIGAAVYPAVTDLLVEHLAGALVEEG